MAHILLVEDEGILGLDIQSRLERLGHDVPRVARSGEDAVGLATETHPDLVLMDIMLDGEMDGVAAADEIRTRCDVPVVFLTAYADDHTLHRAMETSPYGYVLKPFKERELLSTLEVALVKHQTVRQLRRHQEELEHRVEERTADLSRVNAELRREMEEHRRTSEERERLGEQLRRSHKMEALGRLAAGVAHDFNNMLTVINGFADLALDRMEAEHPLRKDVTAIREAGERASTLTAQLLAFGGGRQRLKMQTVDVNESVQRTLKMLQRVLGEETRLIPELAAERFLVEIDPGQLDQALVNLAINARDAMQQDGGELRISTAAMRVHAHDALACLGIAPGPYVHLCVRDNGCGMPKEILARVFEPFYTTKDAGRGTGLGLSVVYGIVQQSRGHIDIDSTPGRGTAVDIYLPRREAGVVVPRPTVPAAQRTAAADRPDACILLVEDDDGVRETVRRILSEAGYAVLDARSGDEAVVVSELHDERIDLLITDVVMPGRSGRRLAEDLIPLRPHLKTLYISGYTRDQLLDAGVEQDRLNFLAKPFSPSALQRRVREILAS